MNADGAGVTLRETDTGDAGAQSLEFLIEPAFLLHRRGDILNANAAGRRLLANDPVGRNLFDFVESARTDLDDYLRRSAGSSAPLVGAAVLRTREGSARYRLHCAALSHGNGECILVLRCLSQHDDRFSLLGKQVRHLNQQLRGQLHEKAVLEETLQQNQDLLRELQHRVKNNIQMMASLIQMSTKQSRSAEFRSLGESLRLRLQALAGAQDALYRSKESGTVRAGVLLDELVTSVGQSFGASSKIAADIADVELSSDLAHGLALIVNELVTNAIKYGASGRGGVIRVILTRTGDGVELAVHDNGPGFRAEDADQASGLRLVRALCRQIGAAFEIANDNGARCSVRFKANL